MLHALLNHTCKVERNSTTVASQQRSNTWSTISEEEECSITQVDASPAVHLMGRGDEKAYRILFASDSDVEVNDRLTWLDRTGYVFELKSEVEVEHHNDAYQDEFQAFLAMRVKV